MKLILDSLDKPKTQKQILDETKLSPRTFRFAVSRLRNLGLVEESVFWKDARIKICRRGDKI
ncbi:MAG: hypothetical protein GOV02_04250 [Candidatus Aenigmarchaeota archaeon]|nr:hypothetical protein [Candidatus Aenigmarchaeota archaeon]